MGLSWGTCAPDKLAWSVSGADQEYSVSPSSAPPLEMQQEGYSGDGSL